ncbi:cytochrome c biogenesis protein CcdA [Deltaproteobacteria bacterium TL4]
MLPPFIFRSFVLLSLALILGNSNFQLEAQDLSFDSKRPLASFEAQMDPSNARAGEKVRVVVSANIVEGWHIYSVIPSEDEFAPPPTKIEWNTPALVPQSPVYETNPLVEHDAVLGMVLAYHETGSKFYQNFKIPENFVLGTHQLEGKIQYQTCSDKLCLPPAFAPLQISFEVEQGPVRPAYAFMNRVIDEIPSSESFLPSANTLKDAVSKGFWAFVLLAAVMGAIAWLTPCVFPMIPVTVSFFSKQASNSHRHLLALAMTFSLGIVLTYTGTGLLLATFMGASGAAQLASNPWINLIISLLFVIFALSLMGFFELGLPSGWIQAADQLSRKSAGFVGVGVMGMVFTLTAFTCTVQFVGTLLIAAAQGEWMWPIIGMLVFSSVFAFPFFLLALFPKLIQSLQSKSGHWMTQLKVSLGFVELMAAFKFLSNADLVWGWGVINRSVVLGVWTLSALGMVLVVLGKFPMLGVTNIKIRRPHLLLALPLLALLVYFGYGTAGKPLDGWTESYMPPELNTKSIAGQTEMSNKQSMDQVHRLPWYQELDKALLQAKAEQKSVFIDFTGYTCVNCRWMEKNAFADNSVFDLLKNNFILVQLYTDGGEGYENNQKLQVERFGTFALPFYVVLSPNNAVLAKRAGISSPETFLQFLTQTLPPVAATNNTERSDPQDRF